MKFSHTAIYFSKVYYPIYLTLLLLSRMLCFVFIICTCLLSPGIEIASFFMFLWSIQDLNLVIQNLKKSFSSHFIPFIRYCMIKAELYTHTHGAEQ